MNYRGGYIMFIRSILSKIYNFRIAKKFESCGNDLHFSRTNLLEGPQHIKIGNHFCCGKYSWIATYDEYRGYKYTPEIVIGNNVSVTGYFHIGSINSIIIKDNVLIGSHVLIQDHAHGETFDFSKPRIDLPLVSKGKIVIEENVWICDNAVILAGAHIGKNCVVAANSVVNKEFPDNCLIGGIPAKILKRYDESCMNK